ncbi:hypothetical protein B0A48_03775 [Cryoendolithus antarcticus]|uniref:F-box domain-containing protein n=1 Tax=Cryoendolithus antarcticus TaxID=1507870 RepID=A0A1V8TGU6_9PEZI|nr:hypothetical protein B0A48_03775 [Cryoendolithus antarcticus]
MASITVLNLPELLEQILIHLDQETILVTRRVSSRFSAIISTSETLQQKLFLRLQSYRTPHDTITMNPLLTESDWLTGDRRRPNAWLFALDPFKIPTECIRQKMHLSSHVGIMQCLILRGSNADHEKTWTIPAESSETATHSSDYNGETLEEFVAKVMNERRLGNIGFRGFHFRNSIWLVDFA